MKNLHLTHIIGIGGIGMSGLARLLHANGNPVQGSDAKKSDTLNDLSAEGIKTYVGHKPENIDGATRVVISSAVKPDNPELMAAKEAGLPILSRADLLVEVCSRYKVIAVSGTHGKTSTTSMVWHVLHAAGLNPSLLVGGIVNGLGTNYVAGSGDYIVVEADESDGTFTHLKPYISVLTNIEAEHLDYYKDMEALHAAATTFVKNATHKVVICADHENTRYLALNMKEKAITYGLVRGEMIPTDVQVVGGKTTGKIMGTQVTLQQVGAHYFQNAMAAFCVGAELGIPHAPIFAGLEKNQGVERRFSQLGDFCGVPIIDDYAHHPTEISATLAAAVSVYGRNVIAVVQPHRYTRLHDHMMTFASSLAKVDTQVILPVYAAGEKPIEGVSSERLAQRVAALTEPYSVHVVDDEKLPDTLRWLISKTKAAAVVVMGAGSSSALAKQLVDLKH